MCYVGGVADGRDELWSSIIFIIYVRRERCCCSKRIQELGPAYSRSSNVVFATQCTNASDGIEI